MNHFSFLNRISQRNPYLDTQVQMNEGQADVDEAGAGVTCCMGHVEADRLRQAV